VAIRILERMGLRVDLAHNGREAVAAFRILPYEVIFMDCQMPEIDGYEATREIRRLEGSNRRVRIIAMTADAMTGTRDQCVAAGMDDYISKPIRRNDLADALRKWKPREEAQPAIVPI
jgi:two-component system, sensor histidine kinase and response regulator